MITTEGGHGDQFGRLTSGVEDARQAVNEQVAAGADLIKIMATGGGGEDPGQSLFTLAELQAMKEEADRLGVRVAAHCHGTEGIRNCVAAGIQRIEHCTFMNLEGSVFDAEIAADIVRNGLFVCPTNVIDYRQMERQGGSEEGLAPRSQLNVTWRKLVQSGAQMVASSDAGVTLIDHDDYALIWELMVEELGMSPMEAIVSGTAAAARALGLEEEIGTLAAGKTADLGRRFRQSAGGHLGCAPGADGHAGRTSCLLRLPGQPATRPQVTICITRSGLNRIWRHFAFVGLTAVFIDDPLLIVDDTIALNAHELHVETCTVDGVPAQFALDPAQQLLLISLPQPGRSPITVHISYNGQINDQYAGLYRSRYEHNGQEKWLATSQFQASDARRVFPCFDHPAQKGTFDLSLLIDQGLTAVSNTEIAQISTQENGKQLIQFARTPKMSPYLLFIGIGEFEFIDADQERFTFRVVTTAGKTAYGRFALTMAAKALRFCEQFTGIDYPLTKCDLIAVPGSIGAMENFGAIRHCENLLLVYPGITSQADRVRIGSIIAHEVSHMWFGNLVSLADWKYLWLNEAFATFFTYAIPEHTNPEWHVWSDFAAESMQAGLERDALLESVPIELPPEQALKRDPAPTPSSAPIIYHKGAAVLRMLEAAVGAKGFKKGLHHYLHAYQYNSVTSSQFWQAFDQASGSDNRDFGETWLFQPGFPLISVTRKADKLHLQQQRFTFSPADSDERWVVPLELLLVREGKQLETRSVLLTEKETAVAIPPDTIAYKANHDQIGFYRVRYDGSNLIALGRLIETRQLSALDSFGVVNDLFALVKRGDTLLDDYLGFIASFFTKEDRYLPLYDITRNLLSVYLVSPRHRRQIARAGRTLCENTLEGIGMEPREPESHQSAGLRSSLLWAAHCFGSRAATQFGQDAFSTLLAGGSIPADILATVLKIGAATHDKAFEFLLSRLTCGSMGEGEMLAYLGALGSFQGEDALRRALDANLEVTPKNLRIYAILAAAENPDAIYFLWDWLTANLAPLRALHPAQMERVLIAIVPLCGLGRETEVAAFCYDFAAENADAADSIMMALEKMAINLRLARRENGRTTV